MTHKVFENSFLVPSGEIKYSLVEPHNASDKLAMVLPGFGYSVHEPLLYYARQILLEKKFSVLALEKVYGQDLNWLRLKTETAARRAYANDMVTLFQSIAERFPGQLHTILARSLGTYGVACALERGIVSPKQIVWQTPALADKWSLLPSFSARSLAIIGTKDFYYDAAKDFLPKDKIVIDGADHGMEIAGDAVQSIEILKRITLETRDWLAGC